MIPNMYKIAGELLPAYSMYRLVLWLLTHCVSSVTIRMLWQLVRLVLPCSAEGSVQEVMDMAAVAHLATAIENSRSFHQLLRWFQNFSRDSED
jgi:pyruvate-ferredoxin/flavodoxin oxidoreductase